MADEYTYPSMRRSAGGGYIIEDKVINPKGRPYLNDADQRAQAALMMMERLTKNKSIEALAKEHNVSTKTVERRLQQARNDDVIRDARQIIIDEFLGPALVTLKSAMASSDLKLAATVAMKIVDGLQVFDDADRAAEVAATNAKAAEAIEESFDVFRARIVRRKQSADSDASGGDIIDAEPSSAPSDPSEADLHAAQGLLLRGDIAPAAEGEAPAGESDRQASVPPRRRPKRTVPSPAGSLNE